MSSEKKKIRILLVGYGRMGKLIHENANYINGEIKAICDPHIPEYNHPLDSFNADDFDVAIEFTGPEFGFENVKTLLQKKIPIVTGSTGWFHKIIELIDLFDPSENSMIYSANFSIGMNIIYDIIENATKIFNQYNIYDIYGLEKHHKHKVDSPSGTARVISEIVINNIDRIHDVVFHLNETELKPNQFSFSSVRAGNIVGVHELAFESEFDDIHITHNAKNRVGFAIGALIAAKAAINMKGFHNFKDIFKSVIIDES